MVLGAQARGGEGGGGGALRTDVMARDYLKRAESRLIDARSALGRGDYPEVVRYSQECVELSLKACLRAVGVEYPKVHDVGDVVRACSDRFPEWMRAHLDEVADISRDLAEKRGPSVYGLEAAGKPASELFDLRDAEDALSKAEFVHRIAKRFVVEFFGSA